MLFVGIHINWTLLILKFWSFSYENQEMALHYGAMLRECIRHQTVAR